MGSGASTPLTPALHTLCRYASADAVACSFCCVLLHRYASGPGVAEPRCHPWGFPPISLRCLLWTTLLGTVGHGVASLQYPLQHILIVRFLFETRSGGRKAD